MDAGSSDTAPRTEPNRTARTLPRQAVAEGAQLCVARGQAVRVLCLRLPRLLLGAGQTRGLRRQLRLQLLRHVPVRAAVGLLGVERVFCLRPRPPDLLLGLGLPSLRGTHAALRSRLGALKALGQRGHLALQARDRLAQLAPLVLKLPRILDRLRFRLVLPVFERPLALLVLGLGDQARGSSQV